MEMLLDAVEIDVLQPVASARLVLRSNEVLLRLCTNRPPLGDKSLKDTIPS